MSDSSNQPTQPAKKQLNAAATAWEPPKQMASTPAPSQTPQQSQHPQYAPSIPNYQQSVYAGNFSNQSQSFGNSQPYFTPGVGLHGAMAHPVSAMPMHPSMMSYGYMPYGMNMGYNVPPVGHQPYYGGGQYSHGFSGSGGGRGRNNNRDSHHTRGGHSSYNASNSGAINSNNYSANVNAAPSSTLAAPGNKPAAGQVEVSGSTNESQSGTAEVDAAVEALSLDSNDKANLANVDKVDEPSVNQPAVELVTETGPVSEKVIDDENVEESIDVSSTEPNEASNSIDADVSPAESSESKDTDALEAATVDSGSEVSASSSSALPATSSARRPFGAGGSGVRRPPPAAALALAATTIDSAAVKDEGDTEAGRAPHLKGAGGAGVRRVPGLNGPGSPGGLNINVQSTYDDPYKNSRAKTAPASMSHGAMSDDSSRSDRESEAPFVARLPLPLIAEMLGRRDGIRRFDKLTMLSMYSRPNQLHRRIKEFYGRIVNMTKDRAPKGYEVAKKLKEDEIRRIEDEIFSKDPAKAKSVFGAKTVSSSEELDENSIEVIMRKANLILNKITPTNFDKLSEEFIALNLGHSDEVLTKIVDTVVDKAQLQENFSSMYAELCKKITETLAVIPAPASIVAAIAGPAATTTATGDETAAASASEQTEEANAVAAAKDLGSVFRLKLLKRCQTEFGVNRAKKLEEITAMDLPDDEKFNKEILLKKRYTGHMVFIGEICLKDLVLVKIMFACLSELLGSNEEGDLLCLIKLFETVGAKVEEYESKREEKEKKKNKPLSPKLMTTYFEKIAELSKSYPNTRIRFMMRDLIDMRANNWQSRRVVEKAVKLPARGADATAASSASQDARQSPSSSAGAVAADEWITVAAPSKVSSKGNKTSAVGRVAPTTPSAGAAPRKDGWKTGNNNNSNSNNSGHINGSASNSNSNSNSNSGRGPITMSASSNPLKPSAGANKKTASNSSRGEASGNSSSISAANQKSSLTSSASAGSSSAIVGAKVDAPVSQLPAQTSVAIPDEVGKRIKSAVAEYLVNDLADEFVQVVKELNVLHNMVDVVKFMLEKLVDSKEELLPKIIRLFTALSSYGLLSQEIISGAFNEFLQMVEDITIDIPKAQLNASNILASLVSRKMLTLEFLGAVSANEPFLPFTMESKKIEFMGSTLKFIGSNVEFGGGVDMAVEAYLFSKVDLPSLIERDAAASGEANDSLAAFVAKYDLPFVRAM